MVDIYITTLGFTRCAVLGIPFEYDFRVICRSRGLVWRATCTIDALQECVERGIAKFEES